MSPADEPEYESFLSDHPSTTAFHTLEWRRAVEAAFDYDPAYRMVLDRGRRVLAAIPGFRVPELLGRSVVNPFCEYGYPLLAEGVDPVVVLEALGASRGRLDSVVVKDCPFSGVRGYSTAGYGGIETGCAVRLSVELPFDRLWERVFDGELRRNVRRARDHGISIEESVDLSTFYELYRGTMERMGSPQFPRSFVRELSEAFGEDFSLHTARKGDEHVAGLLSLVHGDTRHLLLNGTGGRIDDARPNHLLYVDCIERACASDLSVVDFGRTEPGTGVHEFKKQFGGTEIPLASFVTPAHRASRADVSSLKSLEPVARMLSPVVTHPSVGPRLKRFIHE
ncbi:GNAT family N-acetyltransferase [Salinirubellus salinus]|uniref:GNAT family N-acetyltransferase n=1 Tax=Salinirubellus salinus TaxID=1364945 RepID=A0A9E7U863_9EURY|nr:GNAT family N-acetyltransferase [Salinirubellus salinus]UWM54376.1 GNAT family N-acetyltransferase [Salinirubellus salinus]